MTRPIKIYLIAGEPSGDLLGSRFMRAMRRKSPHAVSFVGVGGETMAQEGLKSLFNIADLSVMGFIEVIPSIPKILKHLDEIIADIRQQQPDFILTIDSFSFSIRVHKRLKKAGICIPHAHCVAPQVWAWKKGRAKTIGRFIDYLFCLLPQEPALFTPYGMPSLFIGHPVIEGGADKGQAHRFRHQHAISRETPILCILPGSRRNEIAHLLPLFQQTAEALARNIPNLMVVIPTVETVAQRLKEALQGWSVPHLIITGETERYDAFAASSAALAASGTVSLELALAGVPHLVAYRVNILTGLLARCLLKIRFVNLINILSDKEIIPELLQEQCTPKNMIEKIQNLIYAPQQDVRPALRRLGYQSKVSPSEKMAEAVLHLIRRETP